MCTAVTLALMHFEHPGYLVLLATLPLLAALSIRSLAGLGPIRRVVAIVVRCVVVACMVLALAGAQWVRTIDDLTVIFLLDRSSSVPRDLQEKGFEFVQQSREVMRPTKDRLAVVAFDGQAAIEQLPMGGLGIDRMSGPVQPDQTNLAAALRRGMALLPEQSAHRVVVISDGNENVGAALEEADQYAAAGVPIDVVPLRYQHDSEVIFEQLKAPHTASAEETINLQMVLRSRSPQPVSGKILLYHNDQLVDLDPRGSGAGYAVTLDPGPNRLAIPVPLRVAGAHRFRAEFQPGNAAVDTIDANNQARAFTVVSGQGCILILTTEDDMESAEILQRALGAERLVGDVEIAGENPLDQVRLLEYSLVILSNVGANYLNEEAKKALAVYVRDLGGGLIMIGGDESFGAGGWMGSPIEEIMPVRFDVQAKKQIPKGALVLVMHACEIPRGNYWGERVAVAAVKTLSSRDLVGVLSYQWRGAEQQYWVVPLRQVGNKQAVIQQILKMSMGDLPDLDAVMRPGVNALAERKDAAAKHMIVISDFDPAPPRRDLIDKMKKYGITCSTVAIGFGGHAIDVNKAKWMATQTGGRYYSTNDFAKLPQIFIKESQVVRRSLIVETAFPPRLVNALPQTVAGLVGEDIPQLYGYVLTTPKPLAQIPVVRKTEDGQDPVLAHWQVGLGKTVAFTSGMWPRWGDAWAGWPKFSKLWAQIARWASRPVAATAFDVSTSVQGGRGKIRIDALNKNAAAVNFMTIEGTLVEPGPSYDSQPLRLTQTGPGRYEGEFDARQAGSYILNLAYRMGTGSEASSGSLQTGLSIAYSPEFRELQANEPLLSQLADRTGGRVVESDQAEKVFDPAGLPKAESRAAVWETLIKLMLLLFLLDVAVRRVAINPAELARKARAFIGELAGRRRPAEASAAVLSTLKGTRERLREDMQQRAPASEVGTPPDRSARYEAPVPDSKVTEELSKALGGASEHEVEAPIVARPTRKKPAASEADYTSRLLRAKRRARGEMEKEDR